MDGHNRLEICEANDIAYQTRAVELADRDAAILWIIDNQLGRRNINAMVRSELVIRGKEIIAAKAKENQENHGGTAPGKPKTLSQNSDEVTPMRTDEELAKRAGVSRDTIRKVEHITTKAVSAIQQMARTGQLSVNAAAALTMIGTAG